MRATVRWADHPPAGCVNWQKGSGGLCETSVVAEKEMWSQAMDSEGSERNSSGNWMCMELKKQYVL